MEKTNNKIPSQLKDCRFIKLKDKSKIPYERDWNTKNNYSYNDIYDITSNYGVVCGNGLIVIDIDNGTKPELPKTFTVKTRKGYHYYYKVVKNIQTIRKDFGDIQANGAQVVGPNSVVYDNQTDTTTTYEIIDSSAVALVDLDVLLEVLGNIYIISINYCYDYYYHKKADAKTHAKTDAKAEISLQEFISNGNSNYAFEDGISIIRTNNKFINKDIKVEHIHFTTGRFYPYAVVSDEDVLRMADSTTNNNKQYEFSGEPRVLYVKTACNARIKAEKSISNTSNIIVMYKKDKHYFSHIITEDFFDQNKDTLLYGFTDEIILLIPELQTNILEIDKSELYRKKIKDHCEDWIKDIRSGSILSLTHDERRRLGLYLVRNSTPKETIKELLFDKLVQRNSIEEFESQYRSWKKFSTKK